MLGAIVGDIAGSIYEFEMIKTTDFSPFIGERNRFTDDTVLTLAIAFWLTIDRMNSGETLVRALHEISSHHMDAGYGECYYWWMMGDIKDAKPYGSYGNGSAMRVSPIGLYSRSMSECLSLSKISAEVTHNHPEGIKGAQAIAASVYIAATSENVFSDKTKAEIKSFVETRFGYNLNFTLDDIRPSYRFDPTCQGSVPQAIRAYLEASDFEHAVRLAISLGGDSDTIGCMTGAIAGAHEDDIPREFSHAAYAKLTPDLKRYLNGFEALVRTKPGTV